MYDIYIYPFRKDIGCAYGRNVAAAVRMLGAGHVAPDPRLQVP